MDILLSILVIIFLVVDIVYYERTNKKVRNMERSIDRINNKIDVIEEKVERLERMIFNIRVEIDKKVIDDAVSRIIRNISKEIY